jgi:hypothetical protein
MTDELGKHKVNTVSHRRHQWDIGETLVQCAPNTVSGRACISTVSPVPWVMQGNEYFRSTFYGWNINTPNMLPGGWSIASLSTVDELTLKDDVIDKAKDLKADVLLDLVEANQMWPTMVELALSLPRLKEDWRSIRKVIKTASNAYLAWKFGLKPVLSDIAAINRHLPKLVKDMKAHGDQESHRYSRSRVLVPSFNGGHVPPVGSLYHHHATGSVIDDPEVRYVLVVKPNTKYYSDFFKKADYALSRFATSPFSLAWELVPFSFVADWFVDMRSALRALDNCIKFEPYTVVSFSRSYSYRLGTAFYTENLSPCNGVGLGPWPIGASQYRLYERSPVSTSGSYPRWKPRFGKNQAGITAALISQQLNKAVQVTTRAFLTSKYK